jgi:hypothetical protein
VDNAAHTVRCKTAMCRQGTTSTLSASHM